MDWWFNALLHSFSSSVLSFPYSVKLLRLSSYLLDFGRSSYKPLTSITNSKFFSWENVKGAWYLSNVSRLTLGYFGVYNFLMANFCLEEEQYHGCWEFRDFHKWSRLKRSFDSWKVDSATHKLLEYHRTAWVTGCTCPRKPRTWSQVKSQLYVLEQRLAISSCSCIGHFEA